MSAWRRIGTILGWSAGVCLVVYVVWVSYYFAVVDSSDPWEGDRDIPFTVLFAILVASPFIGGIIGLVKSLRGAATRDKVIWSLLGLVLMVGAWYALAGLAVLGMDLMD